MINITLESRLSIVPALKDLLDKNKTLQWKTLTLAASRQKLSQLTKGPPTALVRRYKTMTYYAPNTQTH